MFGKQVDSQFAAGIEVLLAEMSLAEVHRDFKVFWTLGEASLVQVDGCIEILLRHQEVGLVEHRVEADLGIGFAVRQKFEDLLCLIDFAVLSQQVADAETCVSVVLIELEDPKEFG
jgi:hypothetical protein